MKKTNALASFIKKYNNRNLSNFRFCSHTDLMKMTDAQLNELNRYITNNTKEALSLPELTRAFDRFKKLLFKDITTSIVNIKYHRERLKHREKEKQIKRQKLVLQRELKRRVRDKIMTKFSPEERRLLNTVFY